MLGFKQGQIARIGFQLVDATSGNPVLSVAWDNVGHITVIKADGTTQEVTPSTDNWIVHSAGAYLNLGYYNVLLPGSVTDQVGTLQVAISPSSGQFKTYFTTIQIVAYDSADLYTKVSSIKGANDKDLSQVATDVNAVSGQVTSMAGVVNTVRGKTDLLPDQPASRSDVQGPAGKTLTDIDSTLTLARNDITSTKNSVDLSRSSADNASSNAVIAAQSADAALSAVQGLTSTTNAAKQSADQAAATASATLISANAAKVASESAAANTETIADLILISE